ncbi:UNVERIFIED_ORG: hypothetical protein ABIB52_000577 [Arthrobacter sp. UYCu721]
MLELKRIYEPVSMSVTVSVKQNCPEPLEPS